MNWANVIAILLERADSAVAMVVVLWLVSSRHRHKELSAACERKFDALAAEFGELSGRFEELSSRHHGLLHACRRIRSSARMFLDLVAARTRPRDGFDRSGEGSSLTARLAVSGPRELSGLGASVAERLDVKETVQEELPRLLELVGQDATPCEIQNACFDYAFGEFPRNLEGELRERVRAEACRDGTSLEFVLSVYAVLFTDAVMSSRGIEP